MLSPRHPAPCPLGRVDRLDTRQGSASQRGYSNGNVLPLVARPHGMTHWSPQTTDTPFVYRYLDPKIQGIRATHAPSPWMADYGQFTVMPICGPYPADDHPERWSSSFRHDQEYASPARYAARLLRYGIDLELTATMRCGFLRCRDRQPERHTRLEHGLRLIISCPKGAIQPDPADASRRRLNLVSTESFGPTPDNFGCKAVLRFDRPMTFSPINTTTWIATPRDAIEPELRVAIATSFIDHDQAAVNLAQEVGDKPFETVLEETREKWAGQLDRHQAEFDEQTTDPDTSGRAFDLAVYRSLLFPRVFHEPDAHGKLRHYGAYDGQVHPGPAYTDNGFWDTHRTIMPWIAVTRPRFHGHMIEGFLNAYRESGWLPKWASPGHRDCMCSTHADVVFADAIIRAVARGDQHTAFDVHEAYAAIRKNAFEPGLPDGRCGRVGLAEYHRLGYVPCDTIDYSVCRTLDFAYCDASIAEAAAALGHDADAAVLRQRGQNYRHLWDPAVGFMRGRLADGRWREALHSGGFDEFEWGGPYIEGGPWQHSWTVPQDPDGLAELCGGAAALRQRIVGMLDLPPTFTIGHYPGEIHEMSEMAHVDFGQYAHSNQPSHGILWQVAAVGGASAVSPIIHRVCRELYRPAPDGLAGDEDNGEMSAWFLWACLGRYPLFPAADRYAYAQPFASFVSITPDDGSDPIEIQSPSHAMH